MATNHFLTLKTKYDRLLMLGLTGVITFLGCMTTNLTVEAVDSRDYRESEGNVVRFAVQQTDPVLRITQFAKFQDGTTIRPILYCYQYRQILFGFRRVEESYGSFQTTAPQKKNFIYLPVSEEIASYFLLVRKPIPKQSEQQGDQKTEYELSDWQLLEIPAKDVSKDKPIVFPPFEELAERKLTGEQQELLKDLVARYKKIEAEAKKKAGTPIPPRRIGALPGADAATGDSKDEENEAPPQE